MLKDVKEKLGCASCFPNKNLNPQLEQLVRALEEDDPRVSEKAEAFIEALNRQEAEAIRKETAVGDNNCNCNDVGDNDCKVTSRADHRWACQYCFKEFANRKSRYSHLVRKHKQKPVDKAKCPICGSKDRNQSRHLERHHKEQEGYAAAIAVI